MSGAPETPAAAPPAAGRAPRPAAGRARLQHLGDQLFKAAGRIAALAVPAAVVLMVVFLTFRSLPTLQGYGASLLFDSVWDPDKNQFGALPFIVGTLLTSAIAMAVAVPLGVGAAAFLAEVAGGWVRRVVSFLIELLAAIPSVVYGFWGVVFLAHRFQDLLPWLGVPNTSGRGIFTCGLLLAIMVVPYVTAITYDVCRAVPTAQRQAALALGSTRWQMIRRVVLPYARPGIIGGCFLALGRAVGETMAVAMLIGNNEKLTFNVFDLGYTIPSVIANQYPSADTDLHQSALVQLGLVLLLVTVVVNSLARLLIWNMGRTRPLLSFWRRRPAPAAAPSNNGDAPAVRPAAAPRTTPLVSQLRNRTAAPVNRLMTGVMAACALLIVVPLFHILGYILLAGAGTLTTAFFTNLPIDRPPGLGNALVGTAVMVGLATLGAVPVGILAALYLTEFPKSRINAWVRFFGELLGGVPSIIVGLFVYAMLVAPFHQPSAWAGAFALGLMMVPVVMRSAEESLKLVPPALRNASYALGASRWQTVARVILPAALPAIITGVFLAIGRIAGETAPLLFTASSSKFWMHGLNDNTPFLTYYIYTYSLDYDPARQNLAWQGAVVLLAFIMVLNVGIRALAGARVVAASRAE
jgi:phosphate transport system permease protein